MDWPRIEFHEVCGSNIRLSEDRWDAEKVSNRPGGLCFTSRPLLPGEKLVLGIRGRGLNRGIRFGVTDTDPSELQNRLPDSLRPGRHGHIWSGYECGLRNASDADDTHFFKIYFESVHGRLMIEDPDNAEAEERITGVETNNPVYLVFDIALHNVKIDFQGFSCPEPVLPLTSRSFKNFRLTPAHFIRAGDSLAVVRPHFVMQRESGPSMGNFAFVDTPLKPGSTLIVEIIELKKKGPVNIVLTAESAEDVFTCGCLYHLCEHTDSFMIESATPKAGDELAVRITTGGVVSVSLNNRRWKKRMHVNADSEYRVAFCLANISVLSMVGMTAIIEPTNGNAVSPSPLASGTTDFHTCIMCLVNARGLAFIPCYHVVACADCANSLRRNGAPRCPLCRADIKEVKKIYLS